jgi:nicotinate phosphoribosyltransferase
LSAFRAYASAFPDTCVLLVDTYDTVAGAKNALIVAQELAARGHRLRGVRLDSGDLGELSHLVRRMLDDAGFRDVAIIASGGLDEHEIVDLLSASAPIDIFGVGTRMGVSSDAPYLDMAYKLTAYAGEPRLKLSAGKATWPGEKQVWRRSEAGQFVEDILCLASEPAPASAEPLLQPVMTDGRTLVRDGLEQARQRLQGQRASLPDGVRKVTSPDVYPVRFSEQLEQLRETLSRRLSVT